MPFPLTTMHTSFNTAVVIVEAKEKLEMHGKLYNMPDYYTCHMTMYMYVLTLLQ